MDSYAYNPDNIGHKYINSPQLDNDLKEVAEKLKAEREKHGNNFITISSQHT